MRPAAASTEQPAGQLGERQVRRSGRSCVRWEVEVERVETAGASSTGLKFIWLATLTLRTGEVG